MAKNTTQPNIQQSLAAFGATALDKPRSLTAAILKWTEENRGVPMVLLYLGKKETTNAQGKPFTVTLFMDDKKTLRATSLGVNSTSLDNCEKGDVILLTYQGQHQLGNGRNMNDFSIELIGHSDEF